MKAMFGVGMWNNLVVGVSFWSYQDNIVKFRQSMCQYVAMNQLPGKWSGGSYCILANGACPPGFARYQGHLYAIKMYSHLPQWVGKARFGDSFIQCHGTNCQYTNYAELRLTSCCK